MILTALALALVIAPGPALAQADAGSRRVALEPIASDGCDGVPHASGARELHVAGARSVDPRARFWVLERSVGYRDGRAQRRYRIGHGTLSIESRLSDDLQAELVRMRVETPIEPAYLRVYLPGVALPCERSVRYRVRALSPAPLDLDAVERFDALLHEATELMYDERFAESLARLREASEVRPQDAAPYWMMALTRYLELEQAGHARGAAQREQGYREAEAWADHAVALAPEQPEGYLWRGILRGRILTTTHPLGVALGAITGARGPSFLEHDLQQAVSLPESYRFLGFSTHGNALHALAQLYRMAPDAWYMRAVGMRGDIDRSIELSRQAVAEQPVRIEFRKELAVALLCRGRTADRSELESELRAVLELPATNPLDHVDQQHARALLAGAIPDACGYSRDRVAQAGAWAH